MGDPLRELMPRPPQPFDGPTLGDILGTALKRSNEAQQEEAPPQRQIGGRAGAFLNVYGKVDRLMKEFTGSKGAYADGGRPPVGQPAIVGERGPEVFIPDQPGTIIPNENVPEWLRAAMYELPPELAHLRGPGLPGYDQYDPNTLAAMRMQRGARVPSRYQAPMPPGMTAAETGDVVYRAAFGQPDATIPQALTRPPSTWTPEEQEQIYGGTTQAALMATPAAMTRPITSAAGTIMDIARAAPKTAGAVAGTGLVTMTGTEAGDKASDFTGRAAEMQPQIDALRSRIEDNQNKLLRLSTTQVAAGRTKAQQRQGEAQANRLGTGTAALNDAITQDRARLKTLEDAQQGFQREITAAEERGRPLVERQPWVKYGPVIGGVIAGATALDPRLRAVGQYNQLVNRLGNAVPGVEAAAARTGSSVTNADRLALEQTRAYRDALQLAQKEITPSIGRELAEGGKAAVPGAFVGAELGMLPSQIDLVSQGKDTPAYQAALERFTTLPGWAKTGLNAFVGSTGGSLGAMTPTSWYGRSPQFADLPRAAAAESAYLARLQGSPRASAPGSSGPASPTPQPTSATTSGPPIFDQRLAGGRGGYRDPTTGNIVGKPIDEILKDGRKKR